MVLKMADIGAYAENMTNADLQWKQNWNISIGFNLMSKTKEIQLLGPFPFFFWAENDHSKGGTSNVFGINGTRVMKIAILLIQKAICS